MKNMRKVLKKDYSSATIINIILFSVIIVMPFIITPAKPQYMTGKVLYLYMLAIVLIILLILNKFKINLKKEEALILIFLLTLVIATIFSIDREIAIMGKYARREGLIMYSIYILLFFVASYYIEIKEKTIELICISSCIMSGYAVIQFYGVDPIYTHILQMQGSVNSITTIGNRNFVATYFVLFISIALGIYIIFGKKRYLIYSSILFAGLLSTLTRGGWVAFIAIAIVGLMFIWKRKECFKRVIIVLSIFISIFCFMNITNDNILMGRSKTMIEDVKDITAESGSGRVEIWLMTLKAIKNNPIVGSGLDTLESKLMIEQFDHFSQYTQRTGAKIDKAHNEFLEYWVCGGIFTLLSYISLVSVILYNLYKIRKDDKAKIFILAIVGYLVQSFFNISVIAVAPLYWILLGAAVRYYRQNNHRIIK